MTTLSIKGDAVSRRKIPLRAERVALINLLVVLSLAGILSYSMGLKRGALAGVIMYSVGMGDFAITYWSMKRGLDLQAQQGLQAMRRGMFMRLAFALMTTVLAIRLQYMPWAVLLGLLITHVVLLIESIWSSIKFRSS